VRRAPALVPLSHDHHHALVQARRLRLAADEEPERRVAAARAFVAFFEEETARHFREEEDLLFPLAAAEPWTPHDLLARLLVEHATLRALHRRLREAVEADAVEAPLLAEIGTTLDGHVRAEERELFPLIERSVPPETLARLGFEPRG
jgi:hemerythrin-like domain-containing protein